jgi:dihydroxyacetone kinase DhaKLM complex PTS-EIIA-like component DhaM
VNMVVGQGTALQGDFTTINWGGGPKYLTVSVESAPNVFEELGATQLMSVPYALYAQNVANGSTGGGDNWGAQFAETDPTLKGTGTGGNPLGIAQQNAQIGQVLKWDGSTWRPQDDITNAGSNGGTVTQINTINGITGGPITTSGTIGLTETGVIPGAYGSASQTPVITVDAQGRVTNAFTTVTSPGTVGIVGGAGIAVQQNGTSFTVTNTGDLNPGDDITTTTQSNGDVTGPFSNLQIKNDAVTATEIADGAVGTTEIADGAVSTAKLADNAVTTTKIANNAVVTAKIANGAITAAKLDPMGATNGQVIKWNGTAWAPAADQSGSTNLSGGAGIAISGTAPNFTVTNTGDTNPNDDLTNASTANGDVSGVFSNLQLKPGVVGTPELGDAAVTAAKLDDMNATSGQVLKWNGTIWAPAADQSGSVVITAGAGIAVFPITGGYTISNSGDTDPNDDITVGTLANGDVAGPYTNLQLKPGVVGVSELSNNAVGTANIINGAVTAAKLNNMGASIGQVLTWNGTTWGPVTPGIGAGDNWGTQTAQVGAALTGNGTALSPINLAAQGATSGQVLTWSGSAWLPATPTGSGPGDNWGTQSAATNPTLSGNGTAGSPLAVAQQGATNGQVLTWDNGAWKPLTPTGGGAGDNWGTQIALVGNALKGNGTAGQELNLAQQGAADGQVLKWNSTQMRWLPANDDIGSGGGTGYVGGVGINISGTTISNTGDLSNTNEIQQISLSGNTLALSNGGGNVSLAAFLDDTDEQTLSIAGQTLSISGGNSVTLPAAVGGNNYAQGTGIGITGTAPNFTINNTGDLSNTNEIQQLSLTGNTLALSLGGGSVNVDASATNEIQALSLTGNTLALSLGGGSVTLPASNTYTQGTGISITGAAPNFVINNTGDTDNNPTNELQNLTLNGTTLKISGTNSTVQLDTILTGPGLGLWKNVGNTIFNTNTGNVGVGTTTPSVKLHVKGSGQTLRVEGTNPLISLSNSASGYDGYIWQRSNALIIGTADSSSINFQTGSADAAMQIGGLSGHIGVNTAPSADYQMTVAHNDGGLAIQNASSGDLWEFRVADAGGELALYNSQFLPGTPAGLFAINGTYTSSDRRLKKDISPLSSVLDRMMHLEAVEYRFNQQAANAQKSYGFIAQNVQAEFPELVMTAPVRNGKGGTLMVNYAGFGVLAIKAVQEQQAQIDVLRKENADLRARMDAIELQMKK